MPDETRIPADSLLFSPWRVPLVFRRLPVRRSTGDGEVMPRFLVRQRRSATISLQHVSNEREISTKMDRIVSLLKKYPYVGSYVG